MTKAKIVQRLLDKKHINAEEAVILLKEESTTTYPYWTTNPYFPEGPDPDHTPPPVWFQNSTIDK